MLVDVVPPTALACSGCPHTLKQHQQAVHPSSSAALEITYSIHLCLCPTSTIFVLRCVVPWCFGAWYSVPSTWGFVLVDFTQRYNSTFRHPRLTLWTEFLVQALGRSRIAHLRAGGCRSNPTSPFVYSSFIINHYIREQSSSTCYSATKVLQNCALPSPLSTSANLFEKRESESRPSTITIPCCIHSLDRKS